MHEVQALEQSRRAVASVFDGSPERRQRDVAAYLAHCAAGQSMRSVARQLGAQPSTVLRAVRRVEAARDDPLMDTALAELEALVASRAAFADPKSAKTKETYSMADDATLSKAETTALGRLDEDGAFLLVAKGAERAGVFSRRNGFRRPLSLVPVGAAARFLARDWVRCVSRTDLSARYEITEAGRSRVRRRSAEAASARDGGFAERPTPFARQHYLAGERRVANPATGEIETIQVNLGESPLGWLARRRDARGEPLLSAVEVEAGERLREDFELAQIGPKVGQDWRRFLAPSTPSGGPGRTPSEGPMFARERVSDALEALGPGLADAALRICCFLEGLEATERRMGWSARSGKVVLKLALQRLVEHYGLKKQTKAA